MAVGQKKKRLGDLLVDAGKISQYDLAKALHAQKTLGKKLGEVLIELAMITEDEIIQAVVQQTGITTVELGEIDFDRKVLKLVPEQLCEKYTLIPFGFEANKIQVAMVDPLNIYALDDLAISTGFEIETFISRKNEIQRYTQIYYSSEQVFLAAEALMEENRQTKTTAAAEENIEDVKSSPIVKMLDYLFKNALEMRASDIHIEPFETKIRIRYRIDGVLQTMNELQIESLAALVTRIKIMANLNIAEKRAPQDGRIITRVNKQDIDLRISILPVVYGEKIVIRILNRGNLKTDKAELGLSPTNLTKMNELMVTPHGVILVTGPTGSGKSTTLYTILNELNKTATNIITIEDPVEFIVEGLNQVSVNAKANLTFASGLRSVLRQDPDVVMVGEIRDEETAQIAIRAAITGHLVLSTLHTNDAPSTILRLQDMGIAPYLLTSSITGIVAQRLVRKNCPHCLKVRQATEREKMLLKQPVNQDVELKEGMGCGHCNNLGYYGRIGVYEIMTMNEKLRQAIAEHVTPDKLRILAIESGMTTLENECCQLVLAGETTIEQLLTIVQV
ncbi:MAG: GspE/PulE family protein [Culicoidibacterales bacterium]